MMGNRDVRGANFVPVIYWISEKIFLSSPVLPCSTDFESMGQLVHYHITQSSREIQHSGMEEGEMEKQREGRIRGEKATDATCQSHRYPDY